MKNTPFYCALVLWLGYGCASNTPNDTYILTGKLEGIPEGSVKLIRSDPTDRSSHTVDSVAFEGGRFTLQGTITQPELLTLTIEPGNWSFPVFVEPDKLTVEADTTDAKHYDYSAYGGVVGATITQYAVSGSANQDILTAFENDPQHVRFKQQFELFNKQYEAAADQETREAVRAQIQPLSQKKNQWEIRWIDSVVAANPKQAAGAYLLGNYHTFNESMSLEELERLLATFRAPADTSVYVKRLTSAVEKRKTLLPGNVAPDFTLLTPDSTEFTLSSLRGNYVLLDFWASWCVPCRQAIPHWKEVYAKYHDKGLEIVGITNDSKWSDWFKALEAEQMPWIQVADEFPRKNMPARVGELYMTPYLPTYILLDKGGKIILYKASKDEIDQALAKAMS
ncbi:TlpA disulfide reductase family protein [Parapedobacter tibetensis]|uniref:TlpA disulfide reductase family protein n=1 Tax=Parapedobacter tibetensis TaxID=2972951 RepID=UPI00214D90B4|nr:TlpA disulfide reductase family protein [Parapedobacter tibetensis]